MLHFVICATGMPLKTRQQTIGIPCCIMLYQHVIGHLWCISLNWSVHCR